MEEQNPFKELETNKEDPTDIKPKVMQDISVIKTLIELGDLFSLKLGNVLESFFKAKK